MKNDIISILGRNHKTPIVFNSKQETDAIYTYKGEIYCLKMGRDYEFDELTQKGKDDILKALKEKDFILNKRFI